MRQGAMVFARALSASGRFANGRSALFFSRLKRLALSAPTITPLPPTVTTTQVLLPVQYHSTCRSTCPTIGDGVRATGPDGFAQLARLSRLRWC